MIKLYYYTNDNVAEFKFAGNAILSALDLAQYKVLKAQALECLPCHRSRISPFGN